MATPALIETTVERRLQDLANFKRTIDDLFDPSAYQPTLSYSWLDSLCRSHVRDDDELLIVRLTDNGQVSGLVPLVRRKESFLGLTHVTLIPLADLYGTHSDLLLRGPRQLLIGNLITTLREQVGNWDVLQLSNVLVESQLHTEILEAAKEARARVQAVPAWPSFFIEGERSFDEYLAERSGKFRSYYRRKQRQLERDFRLTFEEIVHPEDVKSGYEQLLYIEEHSWKHDHGTAISAKEHQREFYGVMCEQMARSSMLHLIILKLDDEPVAYDLGLISGNTYYYLKTSFVESYRRSSPSTVLRANMVCRMLERGVRMIDFPAEPYAWESQWASTFRWHDRIGIYNATMRARIFAAIRHMRDHVRNASDRKLEYVDPKANS